MLRAGTVRMSHATSASSDTFGSDIPGGLRRAGPSRFATEETVINLAASGVIPKRMRGALKSYSAVMQGDLALRASAFLRHRAICFDPRRRINRAVLKTRGNTGEENSNSEM